VVAERLSEKKGAAWILPESEGKDEPQPKTASGKRKAITPREEEKDQSTPRAPIWINGDYCLKWMPSG
jgi:hypothetical protein